MTLIDFKVLCSYLWRYAVTAAFFFGLGFALGCGPEQTLPITTTQFVGSTQTELIQYAGAPCVNFDHPFEPRGALSWSAHTEDGVSGYIVPACARLGGDFMFTCNTKIEGYEAAARIITECRFDVSQNLFL